MNNGKYKILVIEDERNIRRVITTLLESNGYKTVSAETCGAGIMLCRSHRPDLVILDLGLPDDDGMSFLREFRGRAFVPVIVLSARSEEIDKVSALDMGASDYITKPFGSAELMARVRSVLRSSARMSAEGAPPDGLFSSRGLVIDYGARRVFIEKNEIKLTQTEYNIIALLSEHAGKVLTYSFIIKSVWGYNDLGATKRLQVNMANIRKKIGETPGGENYIVNELGVGYRMCGKND